MAHDFLGLLGLLLVRNPEVKILADQQSRNLIKQPDFCSIYSLEGRNSGLFFYLLMNSSNVIAL